MPSLSVKMPLLSSCTFKPLLSRILSTQVTGQALSTVAAAEPEAASVEPLRTASIELSSLRPAGPPPGFTMTLQDAARPCSDEPPPPDILLRSQPSINAAPLGNGFPMPAPPLQPQQPERSLHDLFSRPASGQTAWNGAHQPPSHGAQQAEGHFPLLHSFGQQPPPLYLNALQRAPSAMRQSDGLQEVAVPPPLSRPSVRPEPEPALQPAPQARKSWAHLFPSEAQPQPPGFERAASGSHRLHAAGAQGLSHNDDAPVGPSLILLPAVQSPLLSSTQCATIPCFIPGLAPSMISNLWYGPRHFC